MDSPSDGEAIALDANCCIKHALSLGQIGDRVVHDFLTAPIRLFIDRSLQCRVVVGYFALNRGEAERNIVRAVNQLAQDRGVSSPYTAMRFKDRASDNLNRLFSRLVEFPYHVSQKEFDDAKNFFRDHQVDLFSRTGVRKPDNMPDDNDIRLLVATCKLPNPRRMILTEDVDLWGYAEEISASTYQVEIIAARDLSKHFHEWGWH